MLGPIERMRACFGDTVDAAPIVALVELSAKQAGAGARVPLAVPLSRACPGCGGRGETWDTSCRPCGGSGTATERYPLTVTVPAGVADGARFAFSIAHPRGSRAYVEVRVAVL
jgi:DnaJ-class molecular chaperone